jgi:hypothetical protein
MISYYAPIKFDTSVEVPKYFANLIEENESSYTFEIFFSILQSSIVKNKLEKIVINVTNKNVTLDKNGSKILSSRQAYIPKKSITKIGRHSLDKEINGFSDKVKAFKASINSIIASQYINLNQYVYPSVREELSNNKIAKNVTSLYGYVDVLYSSNEQPAMPQFNNLSLDSLKIYNLTLLSKYLIDPSDIIYDEYKNSNILEIKNLRNHYLNDILNSLPKENAYFYAKKEKTFLDKISISTYIDIPKNLANSNLDIAFETYKFGSGHPVSIIRQDINLIKHVNFLKLVKNTKPLFSNSSNQSSSRLSFTQKEGFDSYSILKKEVTNTGHTTQYQKSFSGLLQSNKNVSKLITKPPTNLEIYRCIIGDSISTVSNPTFKNLVIGNKIDIDSTGLVVTSHKTRDNSVVINLVNPPEYAIAFKISRRQFFDKHFSPYLDISNYQYLTKKSIIVFDNTVSKDTIYEYKVFYRTKNGTIKESKSSIFEYINSSINSGISTKISNQNTSKNENIENPIEVKFDIQSSLTPDASTDQTTKIKKLLQTQGIYGEFQNEMSNLTEKFDSLITHIVNRVNLTTGLRESFVEPLESTSTTGNQFIDNYESQKINSVSPLDSNTSYLYEVIVSLRDPVSLIRDYVKQVQIRNKTYFYRPYVWRHPKTIKTGTLFSLDADGNISSSKSPFEHGVIGITATYTASSLNDLSTITDMTAERISINKVRLSWSVYGDASDYDHFILIKEANGKRNFLTTVFSTDAYDHLEDGEFGTILYYIIPIFSDYSVGKPIKSNSVIVDPKEISFQQAYVNA